MAKEIVKKEETNNAVALMTDWNLPIEQSDLIIPRIALMQGVSDRVKEGLSQVGQFVENLGGEVLGDIKNPLQAIFIKFDKSWVIKKATGNKFVRVEQFSPENADAPWEFQENGDSLKRVLNYNFYLLTPSANMEEQLPYVFSLSSTGIKEAKKVVSYFAKLSQAKKTCASKIFKISAEKRENDDGSWLAPVINPDRDSTLEEIQAAYSWYKKLQTLTVKVADEMEVADDDEVLI